MRKDDKFKINLANSFFPFHAAILRKDNELLKALIEKSLDINSRTENGIAPIHLTAYYDLPNIMEILLENGANIDSILEGENALDIAIKRNSTEVVNILKNRNN